MNREELKIGLVGCGRIAGRHIDAITQTNGMTLVAVCDTVPEAARDIAGKTGARWCASISEMDHADVITITTPSGVHYENIMQCLDHQTARWIVCEKPLTLIPDQLDQIYQQAAHKAKTVLSVYQNRYNPIVETMRDLVASGRLGQVYQVIVNVLWNRNEKYFETDWHGTADMDGGVLFTQASHYIDMMIHLLGVPTGVEGFCGSLRGLETCDTASLTFRFGAGTVGSLSATVSAYAKNFATEVILLSERGTIRVSGANLSAIDHWDVDGVDKPTTDFADPAAYMSGHRRMYEHLVADRLDLFPSRQEIEAGISIMGRFSKT